MENTSKKIDFSDPWNGKTQRLSVITLIAFFFFLILAIYDGRTFYSRFQAFCMSNPNGTECKNFNNLASTQKSPKLNMTLDNINGKYSIQIGAYKNENQAKDTISNLQFSEIQGRIIKVKDAKRLIWYQVQFGRFLDRKIATEIAQQLKLKGIIKDFTIVGYTVVRNN